MQQSNCSKACLHTCCLNPPANNEPLLSPTIPAAATINPHHRFASAILSSIPPDTDFTNHESIPSLQEAFSSLTGAFPCYLNTSPADDIRAREYHLSNRVCLDYTGNGLFSYSQIRDSISEIGPTSSQECSHDAASATFFDISYNSVNLDSYLKYGIPESEFQGSARKRIANYMNLNEEDYMIVFTANQISAFKLLADSYPFDSSKRLVSVYDYENEAVQAMINVATKEGSKAQSGVFSWPNFRINSSKLRKLIVNKSSKVRNRGLFVFPLQSRMTGARYAYQWMNLARDNGWHVVIDASAFGAKEMETLGLSIFQPDFLICSFFKVFGLNPSGFCCLFVKKSRVSDLTQSSAALGIISLIPTIHETPQETKIIDEENQKSRIEFRGLDHADKIGLILTSSRGRYLVNWLVNALLHLRHPHSGLPLIRISGPRIKLDRGPSIAFNVYDWKGERIDPNLVQKLADRSNISLTCGFLKNIHFSKNSQREKEKLLEIRNPEKKIEGKQDWGLPVASISIGMLNNFEDVFRVWGFVARFLDADFVEKERWRYTELNQSTVEI